MRCFNIHRACFNFTFTSKRYILKTFYSLECYNRIRPWLGLIWWTSDFWTGLIWWTRTFWTGLIWWTRTFWTGLIWCSSSSVYHRLMRIALRISRMNLPLKRLLLKWCAWHLLLRTTVTFLIAWHTHKLHWGRSSISSIVPAAAPHLTADYRAPDGSNASNQTQNRNERVHSNSNIEYWLASCHIVIGAVPGITTIIK